MIKKSIFIVMIFIVSYLCFWNVTYASNLAEAYLASSKMEVNKEGEFEITANIQGRKVSACNFYIYFDEAKVEFISSINQDETNLQGNRLSFVWFDRLGGKGAKEGEIASFKFRAKEDGLASFVIEGEFYGENGELIETSFKGEQVQIGKKEDVSQEQALEGEEVISEKANTNLEILAVENALLYPSFEASHTDYEVEVSNKTDSLNIFAVPENELGTVQITGKDNLKEGSNLVTVLVKAEDGVTEKMYNVKVNRRNLEEEKKYEEDQAKRKEELENAYKIEKVSKVINEPSEGISKKEENNYITIVSIIILILLISIGLIVWGYIRKRK